MKCKEHMCDTLKYLFSHKMKVPIKRSTGNLQIARLGFVCRVQNQRKQTEDETYRIWHSLRKQGEGSLDLTGRGGISVPLQYKIK